MDATVVILLVVVIGAVFIFLAVYFDRSNTRKAGDRARTA